ncbi:CoA pyrophosphatase [Aquimarina sp. 2201CG1-2-11]|uniref:NUDIX hydrolase n=1 Tax=Aquimarina discodermiae TaxID=3231043 RepID=UPI00346384D9
MSVPGESSHYIMAPEVRKMQLDRLNLEEKKPRNAAVMMLFYPVKSSTHFVLILRPIYKGVHSGQVALPGGKVEKYDEDYTMTALRETEEEVGVEISKVKVLKPLTKVYIPPSNFWVHPFLGYTEDRPDFVIQEEEVAKVIEVPIQELLDENNVASKILSTSYAKNIEVPSFDLKGYTVWGATAMMLSELKTLFKTSLEL